MKKAIIGIGSPFGDDQLGWLAIDTLRQRQPPITVDLLDCDRPGPQLLNLMQPYHEVVLIDAMQSGAKPGAVVELDLAALTGTSSMSSHQFGLAESLLLGKKLGMLPSKLRLLGIEIGPLDVHAQPSQKFSLESLTELLGD